ncbi:MAG: hypothetical protein ACP5PX_01160 [Candidatus Hadarchaeum sp.]|uniref:hypothetical protein n=1 Tax=Candidatus Hadarchaeum sp. TaxID=2883567 RepID=UPI003D0D35DD
MLATAGLIDTATSITNNLVLNRLAHVEGTRLQEYVVDVERISSLEFRQEIGGENYSYQITILFNPEAGVVFGPFGPSPPDDNPVSAISVPITLYQNGRLVYAKMEVKVWRA